MNLSVDLRFKLYCLPGLGAGGGDLLGQVGGGDDLLGEGDAVVLQEDDLEPVPHLQYSTE